MHSAVQVVVAHQRFCATIDSMSKENAEVRRVTSDEYAVALGQVEQMHDESVSFLQAPLYGQLQEKDGKEVVYFVANIGDMPVACGLAVRYTAPFGMNFLYCPYGPFIGDDSVSVLPALQDFFKPIARSLNCAFVRLDVNAVNLTPGKKPIPDELARTASLQPRAEWILDITPSEDDLWMGFHKHARYNTRLAERAQAVITCYSPDKAPLDDFFALMQTTAGRDSFGIFDREYYQAYLDTMSEKDGFMTVCTIDGKPAAAGLFVAHDGQAHYVFAGSSDDYRKIAPAYSVIWESIKEAKKRGCSVFNFGGVSDEVKGQALGGVTAFKKRFGGMQVDHTNPIDLVYENYRYMLFRLYKKLRG